MTGPKKTTAPPPQPVSLRRALRRRAGRAARSAVAAAERGHLASVVLDSGVFDADWYAAQTGCDPQPQAAARHYVSNGGTSPHPLVDIGHLRKRNGPDVRKRIGKKPPLLAYLTDPALHDAQFHPLFDVAEYVAAHPQARRHKYGPLGHYVQTGAKEGFAPNAWFRADPAAEPDGLTGWLRDHRHAWDARAATATSPWTKAKSATEDRDDDDLALSPTSVTVVVPSIGRPNDAVVEALESVLAQEPAGALDLDVVLVHAPGRADDVDDLIGESGNDPRVRTVVSTAPDEAAALADGAATAQGEWTALFVPGTRWLPDHLANVITTAGEADAAYDVVERTEQVDDGVVRRRATVPTSLPRALVQPHVFLGALVVRTATLAAVGGLDPDVHGAMGHDLELRLLRHGALPLCPKVGVVDDLEAREAALPPLRDRPGLDVYALPSWHQVVLDRQLSNWDTVDPQGEPGVVSIIIPTYADALMTARAVARVVEAQEFAVAANEHSARIEIVVVDNGCDPGRSARLAALAEQYPWTTVLHEPVNRGFSLGNNVAVQHTRGEVVVFLNNDTEVVPGWLDPLLEELAEPEVLGVQSLLVFPSGSVQSAGIAFPTVGGVPHMLLQGYPVEDAEGVHRAPMHAATAAALAVRRADVVALRGFDTIFRNGMEDVDLGLRLRALRSGHLTVRTDSVVVHHESRTPGRFVSSLVNRQILLDRYGDTLPGDDETLWSAAGYEVVGHEFRTHVSVDRRLTPPSPVVRRRALTQVHEGTPALRWALKSPAPAGAEAQRWGDTHFIHCLSESLQRLGQQVVVDHRSEFDRPTGHHDDVALVLRGLTRYAPTYGQVSLLWLISHPERFTREEAETFDRVFAASVPWAEQTSRAWGVRIDPLLQATDPARFHPGRGRPDTGHPVLFVGSSRRVFRPMVRDAIELGLPLSLYGEGWDTFVPPQYLKARYLPNVQVGEFYRRAGVVLNDHWEDMRLDGFLSNRLFDAVACGARVVSDDVHGMTGLFGRSVQVARTPEELAALTTGDLDAVFGDENERDGVAKRVHAEHSFDARAQILLDTALELRKTK